MADRFLEGRETIVLDFEETAFPQRDATFSASPPGAKAMARRSAAWSTAVRPASASLADIQAELDKRRPGQSRFVTQRREDEVKILSGFILDEDGETMITTGTPVSMLIENVDQRSKDYGEIARQYRPGHADYTYDVKYGVRDYRGGGRSSARETAARVAAGALARKVVPGVVVRGALVSMGEKDRPRQLELEFHRRCGKSVLHPRSGFRSRLHAVSRRHPQGGLLGRRGDRNRRRRRSGRPRRADLCQARPGHRLRLMSINAVKGVEIGNGFEAARITGEQNADEMRMGNDGKPVFLSNNAGGILGGISTGQAIVARFAVKPTSSILTPRKSIDKDGKDVEIMTKGRHDPCVGIRAVPIGEAMVACAIADHYLRHRGQTGRE
jgi:chorismate synthase